LQACSEHIVCACVSECLAPDVDSASCQTHCTAPALAELDALLQCVQSACADECGHGTTP
jgi:hypothetical protein